MNDRPELAWLRFYEGLLTARHLTRPTAAHEPGRHRVGRAKQLIDSVFAEELDLDRLAADAYLSRFHFARCFRETFGEPPHRYLQRRRIEAAQRLLETTDLSVTEICLEVGFSSLGSFSRLFAERVGAAPSRYRRRFFPVGIEFAPPPRPIPCCFLSVYSGLTLMTGRPAAPDGSARMEKPGPDRRQ